MGNLKNFIILATLGVAGYFAYQYFGVPWLEDNDLAETDSHEVLMFLPDRCQESGKIMLDAFYKNKQGEIVKADVHSYRKTLRECLKYAGYDESQIDEAYDRLADSAGYKNY